MREELLDNRLQIVLIDLESNFRLDTEHTHRLLGLTIAEMRSRARIRILKS